MSARWCARALLLASALGLGSCSLVALSEDIVQGTCQDNSDCDVLNDESDPDFDPCQRWQCNGKEKLCRYGKLDADGDEQTPATVMHRGKRVTCERDERKQDCDDAQKLVGSGFTEQCDLRDNDCDGKTDEAVLEQESTRAVVFAGGDGSAAATDASYARDPMTGAIAIGYGMLQGANARPGASLLDAELMTSADATALGVTNLSPAFARQVALAPLDGGRFAYALSTTSGKQRLLAGVWRTSANQIAVERELAQTGLPCGGDGECGAMFLPALASLDRQLLVAYLRSDAEPSDRSCNRLEASDPPVSARYDLLRSEAGGDALTPLGAGGQGGGQTRDLSRPALLTLPAIGELPASWLFAYADVDGSVRIEHVTRDGASAVVSAELIRLTGGAAPRSAIALALGPGDDGGQRVGVAYQLGCGSDARVVFDVLRLRDDGGELAAERPVIGVAVGGASNETQPALAYSAERDVWLIAYRDLIGLRARVVGDDGVLHGTAPYTLIERVKPADGDEVDVLPLPLAALELGDGFAALAHVLRAGEEDPRAFDAVRLGCGL